MISVSLLELAKTGELGAIHIGMSRKELHILLGDPPLWGTQENLWKADIWRFEDIEIY